MATIALIATAATALGFALGWRAKAGRTFVSHVRLPNK